MKPAPPSLGPFGLFLKWLGVSGLALGFAGSAFAVVSWVQTQTGWGLSSLERCCLTAELNKAALALLLGCMFFVLAGSGLILLSYPLLRSALAAKRWPRWLARVLFAYSACCLALGVILIAELGGRASGGIVAGLVTYCVMVAAGLLVASWGMRRVGEDRA